MNEQTLIDQLRTIEGEDPSPAFIDALRLRIDDSLHVDRPAPSGHEVAPLDHGPVTTAGDEPSNNNAVTLIEIGRNNQAGEKSFGTTWPLVAAAALIIAVSVALLLPNDDAPSDIAAASEARSVGDAWVMSIIGNDKDAFVELHDPEFETNDTLMAYSRDADLLTSARVSELYFDGFDAFQASLAADGDFVRSDGCLQVDDDRVRCGYTASMIGTTRYTYSVTADLTVADGRITDLEFAEITTKPADLRDEAQRFFDEAATDEDRSCLLLGFNTPGCGEHDSDFMRRYVEYYEARQDPADG